MKIYLTFLTFAIFSCSSWAQSNSDSLKHAPASNEPLTWVEVMPKFPGGTTKLLEFITRNINYPIPARENGIQGRVIVRFVVDENGNVTNVGIPKGMGIGAGCDEEAIRVVSSLPKWEPGTQKGIAVPVWYTVPVVYKIQTTATTPATLKDYNDGQGPFTWVEEMPKYPGGSDAMYKFISDHINYSELKGHGIATVRFVVDEKGDVEFANIPKGMEIGGGCDEEAIRVISLTKWIAGKQNGHLVAVWQVVRINF